MKPDSTDTTAADLGSPPSALLGAGQNEFPEGAMEFTDEPSRRRFLTLMGASVALATGAGCNLRPASQRKIIPYTTQPDELTPGVPLFYASATYFAGYGQGILVRSNEGRPTKVEGNPDHPASLGGTDLHAQASILDLYDPDRSRGVTHRGSPASYERAVAAVRGKLFSGTNANAAVRIRLVTETVTSPTLTAQISQLLESLPERPLGAIRRDQSRQRPRRRSEGVRRTEERHLRLPESGCRPFDRLRLPLRWSGQCPVQPRLRRSTQDSSRRQGRGRNRRRPQSRAEGEG